MIEGTRGAVLTPSQRKRAIVAATVGNGLEFYDFITFAFFAIQIGQTFFPFKDDPFLSLMASLATFGAGFATRPLGAFVLGRYADRHGRKPAMLLSMLLMGLGILMLALTPGYHTIGYAAPAIAVTARLIQGFALGGEVGSATAYLIESADTHRRGWTVSWQGGSQQIAATMGSLVGFLLSLQLSEAELAAYGWRIALLLGATIVPFAIWVRNSLPETLHKQQEPDEVVHSSLGGYARVIVLGCLLIGCGTISTHMFNYMATFGQTTLNFPARTSLFAQFGLNFTAFITIVWGGWASDRWGRKRLMLIPQAIFLLSLVPVFLWITTSLSAFAFIAGTLFLSGISAMRDAAVYAGINASLPRAVRARAFALIYSIPVAVLGGTTQPFIAWLLKATGNPLSIAIYLTGVAAIGLVAMVLMRESSPRHRRDASRAAEAAF